jgi:hypothetical protein
MNAPKRTNTQNALTLSSLVMHSDMYLEVGVQDYTLKLSSDITNNFMNLVNACYTDTALYFGLQGSMSFINAMSKTFVRLIKFQLISTT